MLLRLIYLSVTNVFALLRLLPGSDPDKDAEILVLRHQITVLRRQLGTTRPRLLPGDRAFLAALLHRLPRGVLDRFRLLVRPDTVLRWHRDLVARRHAARSRPRRPEVPRTFRTVHPLGWTIWKGKNLPRPKKSFSPEYKDEAVKMVIETSRPIARVAKELGINEGTLGNWVAAYRRDHAGEEPPLTVSERARLREAERENRELKMENEFLKKAAAYFARDHR